MQVTKPTFDTYKDTHRKDGRTSPLHLLSHAGGRSGGSRDIGGVAARFAVGLAPFLHLFYPISLSLFFIYITPSGVHFMLFL